MRLPTLVPVTAAAGLVALGYAGIVERNWFALRRFEIPVLPPGTGPLRVLHISDAHLTPGRRRLQSWIRSLDDLDPHLVVNTGDSIAHPQSVRVFLDSLGPLLDRPGVFVLGSNDLYAPEPFNPARYLLGPSSRRRRKKEPDLPWEKLRDGMTAAGWLDLDNQRGQLTAGGLDIAAAGVHDSHIKRDRYAQVAGRAEARADLRLGVMHSPEPRLLDQFAADGYDLLLAGHTHGGQLCLPGYGTLITNCGIDRKRARGLHRYPADGQAWLHVSAGLGTSPWAPARFACRPEASLLTLVSRDTS
ncbi:MAG TPA: metallophosphoesterase [Streptosporangiaceae bacterium]|nr:metallophosphoesterase [Streptosporangiaceae bacterium]HLN66237.1 metallophosphoesterase [Streptosporangiaceae bacterium]